MDNHFTFPTRASALLGSLPILAESCRKSMPNSLLKSGTLLLVAVMILTGHSLRAQCTNASQFGTINAPITSTPVTITTCAFGGEYSTINSCVSGSTYLFNATGGAGNYITIRQGTPGGPVLGFGFAPVSVVCTASGPLYLHYNTNAACGTDGSCHTGTVQCTSCPGAPDPCASIATILCTTPTTATLSGSGLWSPGSCGFSTPGSEKIYSFTPASTGVHSLQVTSTNSGGFIDYFFKAASGGCNSTGWTCIDDIFSPVTVSMGTLTAGTTYYILLDPETTSSVTHTFQINCPAVFDPCATIPVLACSTAVTATSTGTGIWSPSACGFSTPGQEKVYSFTPTTTGVHTLQVTAASGGFVDYFYKAASGGCNSSGWLCIDDINTPGTANIGTLTAGTTYYILFDPESTGSVSQTFQIDCPAVFDPCATIPVLACSTAVTATSSGTGIWSPNACGFTTPGQEKVYSFTPTVTGMHTLVVTATNSLYADYFYKAASGGCNASGWTCIDDISLPVSTSFGPLTAGTTYYLLFDPETTASITQTFRVDCPSGIIPCATNPSPAVGSNTCPNTNTTLSWSPEPSATAYDVYFGTSATPPFVATTASTSYNAGSLPAGTYYWQIRPLNTSGTATGCMVWSFTKVDNTSPTINCPASVTTNATAGLCSAVVSYGAISASDNCTAPNIALISGLSSGSSFPVGTTTMVYRATDAANNTATCSFTVTVVDNQPPVINCPANITANTAPGLCTAVVTYGAISASDNCTAPSITLLSGLSSGSTFPLGTTTIVFRAADGAGNSSTCSFTVTVVDIQPPTITCPANVSVQCASLVPPVNIATVAAADNCGPPVVAWVNDVISNQTCVNRYTLTRTYRATDASGNTATCAQTITVNDNTAPVVTFTDPLLEGATNGGTIYVQCEGQDPEWELPSFSAASVSATDNCNGNVTISFLETLHDEGDCSVDGYINIYRQRWIATDACGNSTTVIVYVQLVDEVPPVIHGVPADIQVNCDEVPAPPDDIYATDECLCACVILFSESVPAPGCRDGQVITRSWTATDDCGNVTVEKQLITLIDEKGPDIRITQPEIAGLPDGTILEYTCNEGGIPAFYDHLNVGSVYSEPSCGTAGSITFDTDIILSNNCDHFGYIEQRTFQWVAIDQCGNQTSLTLTAHLIDDQPPVLIGVPSLTCDGDPALNQVEAVDNCGNGNVRYWDVPVPNPCGTGTAIRRTYEGFDPCGNSVRDTAIILMNNNNGPSIVFTNPELAALLPGEILIVNCQASGNQYTSFGAGDVMVSDDCPLGLNLSFQETVVQTGDCTTGNGVLAEVQLQWTATDMCGHSSQLIVMVHIVDQTPPMFLDFDEEMTIGCNDLLPNVQIIDNCGEVNVEVAISSQQGDCPYEYDLVRVYSATDPCGNKTVLTQTIHVGDGSGPIIYGVVEEVCDDLSLPRVMAYDPCADQLVEVSMTESVINGTCHEGRVVERVWTATDACGNLSEKRQRIIMDDHTAPAILIPTHSVILKFLDTGYRLVNLSDERLMDQLNALDAYSIFIEDECDEAIIPAFSLDVSYADNCMADGYYERRTYTWVATDVCGNSSVLSITMDITDDVAPVIGDVPGETTIICGPLPTAGTVSTDDYAQPVTVAYSQSTVDGASPGEYHVTRRWIAMDVCGNTSEATQHITWIPDTQLSCDIFLPESVDCNSHEVPIASGASGGLGDIIYAWEVFGEKCFIQSGQGTPDMGMYIGWDEVEISLTLTDAYGCTTTCSTTLDCEDLAPNPLVVNAGDQDAQPGVNSIPAVISTAGNVDEAANLMQFNLWPNPASDAITIRFESLLEQAVQVSLVNFTGQTLLQEDIIAAKGITNHQVDLSTIPEGGYMVQLRSGKEFYTKVIMVIRKE
jgi:hypothetical protein